MSLALSPARAERGGTVLAASTEPVQPVFTRYWLHNCGPAPMGNLPVALTLRPDDTADGVGFCAQVVCDDTDGGYDGELLVRAPEGWVATPRSSHVTVAAGATSVCPSPSRPRRRRTRLVRGRGEHYPPGPGAAGRPHRARGPARTRAAAARERRGPGAHTDPRVAWPRQRAGGATTCAPRCGGTPSSSPPTTSGR